MAPENILVGIDFSEGAERALDFAVGLSKPLGARVHVVNAIGAVLPELAVALTDQMIESVRRGNQAALDGLVLPRRALTQIGQVVVEPGDPRDAIPHVAKAVKADLIVLGTHGRRGISRMLLGSVAEDVLRRAPCPVLVVPLRAAGPK